MQLSEKYDVVIIGAGLTGLTMAYYLIKAGKEVLVVEKNAHVGGVIQSRQKAGFIFESGPNTGVLNSEEIEDLFADLGSKCQPELPGENAKQRWIWKGGKWRALASGIAGAFTPLFTFKDKLRVLGEPWRKPGTDPDETVADMVVRRLGKSILDYAVDPFVSGIYAGDPNTLVTRYALPKLYRLEHESGSFIRGTMQKQKDIKAGKRRKVSGSVFSAENGMAKLTETLAAEIGEKNIVLNAENASIDPLLKGFRVQFTHSSETVNILAEKVVSTAAAHALPKLLPFVEPQLMENLNNLRYAKVLQVAAGYKKWEGMPINAYGGLIPSCEKRKALGVLFMSSLFKNRAPEGGALVSVFAGGMRNPEWIKKSDEEVQGLVKEELKVLLKVAAEPDMMTVFRYQQAIPQYEITTGKRLSAVKTVENTYPGLTVAGNLRDGIGMGDRVKQARQIANQLIEHG